MPNLIAFFSYATKDWDAPADGPAVQELVTKLEAQVHAETGHDAFKLWQDKDNLRWGDDWRNRLLSVIDTSHLFIALVSPSWLNSDYCLMEYEAFKTRAATFGDQQRILPISLREIDDDHLSALTDAGRTAYAELRAIQMQQWQDLPLVDPADLRPLLQSAAKGIRSRMIALTPAKDPPAATPPPDNPPPEHAPVDGHVIPPVSGDYYCPSQGQGGCMLRLAVSGLAEVETAHGNVLFEISGLTVQTEVSGARIVNEHTEFSTGWDGPIARVTRIQSGATKTALSIEAHGTGLRGEPLVARGDAGHVRLFDLDPSGDGPITITGSVRIARRAVKVTPLDSDPNQPPSQRDEMIKALTDIVMEKHVHDTSALDGWAND